MRIVRAINFEDYLDKITYHAAHRYEFSHFVTGPERMRISRESVRCFDCMIETVDHVGYQVFDR